MSILFLILLILLVCTIFSFINYLVEPSEVMPPKSTKSKRKIIQYLGTVVYKCSSHNRYHIILHVDDSSLDMPCIIFQVDSVAYANTEINERIFAECIYERGKSTITLHRVLEERHE